LAGALAVRYKTDSVEDDLSKKKGYNLLSDEVAGCESTDGWTNSNTTDATDSSNSFVGLNCLKVTLSSTTGSLYRNVLSLLDTSKHYFFSAYVKNGDTSTGIKFGITVTGDTGSAETSRITSTDYTRVGVILQPSGFESASTLNIYVDLAGSSSQYAYVDAICIQEITKEEYDGGATALLTKYSYMDSEGISTFAEVTSVDDVAVEGRMDGLLIGRSDANLLEDDVAGCESTSGWTTSNVTLTTDSSNNLEGNNCLKLVQNVGTPTYIRRNIFSLFDVTKYWLLSISVKNVDLTSGISLSIDSDDTDITAISVSTIWTRIGIAIRPEDLDTANYAYLRIRTDGSSSQYGYVDAIALQEITAEDYNSLSDPTDASSLFDKYPYHRGLAGSGVGRVKSVGKNLFDKTQTLKGYFPNSSGIATADSTSEYSLKYIKVSPSTEYNFDGTAFYVEYNEQKDFIQRTGMDAGGLTTSSNTHFIRLAHYQLGIDYLEDKQLEQSSTATTYEPYRTSQVYNDRELYSVPSGTHCTKDLNTGKYVKRVKRYELESGDVTALTTSPTNTDYVTIDMPADCKAFPTGGTTYDKQTLVAGYPGLDYADSTANENTHTTTSTGNDIYIVVPKGTYADLAAAQAALAGTVIHYELDPDSYETHYDQPQVLQAFPNGTIYNETVIEEMLTYSTGLTITSTDHVIDSLEYVYLVDTTTKAETPIDISDCTIASGGASFTISGASNDEVYRFAYRYNGSGIIAPLTYSYCMTAKDTLDGNTEDINSLHERINLLEKIIRTLV
jgi:hypothetical protein